MEIKIPSDGFIRLVDHMGTDESIIQAARISYGSGTKSVSDDTQLIRYLMRHRHTTPFEMCEVKFHIRIPMDTWRQMVRHRTANINEYSTRYSEAIDSMNETPVDMWRTQSTTNKQGSGVYLDENIGSTLTGEEQFFHDQARKVYKERLDAGVAREQARKDLPLSTYTECYWKNDLHNIFHFLKLRLDKHAQLEIRQYAEAMAVIIRQLFPISFAAFEDYVLKAITFTAPEIFALGHMIQTGDFNITNLSMSKRETIEFREKLFKLGVIDL